VKYPLSLVGKDVIEQGELKTEVSGETKTPRLNTTHFGSDQQRGTALDILSTLTKELLI
jgi:hypothetical protein